MRLLKRLKRDSSTFKNCVMHYENGLNEFDLYFPSSDILINDPYVEVLNYQIHERCGTVIQDDREIVYKFVSGFEDEFLTLSFDRTEVKDHAA